MRRARHRNSRNTLTSDTLALRHVDTRIPSRSSCCANKKSNINVDKNEHLQFVLFARLLLFAAHLNHRYFLLIALTLNGEAGSRLANARCLDAISVACVPHGLIGQVVVVLNITRPALFMSLTKRFKLYIERSIKIKHSLATSCAVMAAIMVTRSFIFSVANRIR